MKVRKKNKIGSFFTTIIIFCMIAIVFITVVMDQSNDALYEDTKDATEQSYNALEQSLKALQNNLKNLLNGVSKLDGVDIGNADWEGASAAYAEMVAAIEGFEKEYFDSFTNEDTGVTYVDYFNYLIDADKGILAISKFAEFKESAMLKLSRAASKDDMTKIVEQYKKDVKSVATNLDLLYANISSIEANGLEVSDIKTYLQTVDMFNALPDGIFAFDPDNSVNEKKDIKEKLNGFHDAFGPVFVDAFVAEFATLPSNFKHITLDNHEAIKNARLYYDALTGYGFYTAAELDEIENPAFHKAEKNLESAEKRMSVVLDMYGEKDDEGNIIEGVTALWINAQIESYKNTKITLSADTAIWINKLDELIKAWDTKYGTVKDSTNKDYCEAIYNMVDRATVDSYKKTFKPMVATLKEEADHFVKEVNKLLGVEITYFIGDQIDIIELIIEDVNAASKNLKFNEVDYVLGNNSTTGVNAAYVAFVEYKDAFDAHCKTVDAGIADANAAMNEIANADEFTDADIAEVDALIVHLFAEYGINEGHLDAKTLDSYKEVRMASAKAEALATAKEVYDACNGKVEKDAYTKLESEINGIGMSDYTLTLNETKDGLVETGKAVDLRTKFTDDYCYNVINSIGQ